MNKKLLAISSFVIVTLLFMSTTVVAGKPKKEKGPPRPDITALQAAVDDNTAAISINASSVSTNSTSIGGNSQSITNVSQSVDTNTQDIDTVAQAVAALMPPPSFQFVGFSTATLSGSAGIFVMNAACHADFGTNSRMASSREILDSTTQPILNSSSTAWVRPVIVAGSGNASSQYVWDYSGLSHFRADISCGGWSTTIKEGISINGNGIFAVGLCGALKSVACSAPQ